MPSRDRSNARRRGNHQSPAYRPASTSDGTKVDWRRTLARGQRFLVLDAGQRRDALSYKSPIQRSQDIDLVILDTSASVLEGGGLGLALGLVEKLAGDCYRQRRKLGIIVFGNDDARILLYPQKPGKVSADLLDSITGGGGTPLLPALDIAQNLLNSRISANHCRIYLLTDGRVEESACAHPLFARRQITVVDMESGRVPLGRARQLADSTGADYTHMQQLRSD